MQPRKMLNPAYFSISITPCLRCSGVFKKQSRKTLTPAGFSIPVQEFPMTIAPSLMCGGVFKTQSSKTIVQARYFNLRLPSTQK